MPVPLQRTRAQLSMVHLPPIVVFGRSEKLSLFAMRSSSKDKETRTKKDSSGEGGFGGFYHSGPTVKETYLDGDNTDDSSEDEDEDDDPKKLQHHGQHHRKQDQTLREALSKRMRTRVKVTKARPKSRPAAWAEETTWPGRAVKSVHRWLRTCLGDDGTDGAWVPGEQQYRKPLVISAPMFTPRHAATSFVRTSTPRPVMDNRRISTCSTASRY